MKLYVYTRGGKLLCGAFRDSLKFDLVITGLGGESRLGREGIRRRYERKSFLFSFEDFRGSGAVGNSIGLSQYLAIEVLEWRLSLRQTLMGSLESKKNEYLML
jgi:hypothetical protein